MPCKTNLWLFHCSLKMHYFKLQSFGLFYSLISVSFENDCTLQSINFIPFIIRIVANRADCWGVVISTTEILVNERCVNESTPLPIYLITHNKPPADIVTVPSVISLNSGLNSLLPAHSQNDWILLGMPSPLKFTQFLKAANFPLESSPKGPKTFIVVFKSGRLALSAVQIEKAEHCQKVYGEKFESNLHYCILEPESPNDDHVSSVKDTVAHLMLNEGSIVGLILPGSVNTRWGKAYRVLKIAPVIHWLKSFTSLTNSSLQENLLCNPITSSTTKQLIETVARETLQQLSEEYPLLLLKNVTDLQKDLNEAKLLVSRELDARFREAQKYVEEKGQDIMKNIEERQVSLLRKLEENEGFLNKMISEKLSDVEKALREKDSQIQTLEDKV